MNAERISRALNWAHQKKLDLVAGAALTFAAAGCSGSAESKGANGGNRGVGPDVPFPIATATARPPESTATPETVFRFGQVATGPGGYSVTIRGIEISSQNYLFPLIEVCAGQNPQGGTFAVDAAAFSMEMPDGSVLRPVNLPDKDFLKPTSLKPTECVSSKLPFQTIQLVLMFHRDMIVKDSKGQ